MTTLSYVGHTVTMSTVFHFRQNLFADIDQHANMFTPVYFTLHTFTFMFTRVDGLEPVSHSFPMILKHREARGLEKKDHTRIN